MAMTSDLVIGIPDGFVATLAIPRMKAIVIVTTWRIKTLFFQLCSKKRLSKKSLMPMLSVPRFEGGDMAECSRRKAEARCRKKIRMRQSNAGASEFKLEIEQRYLIKIFSGSDVDIYRFINVMIWAKVYTRIDLGVSG